jgi:hypothetical protein
MPNSFISRITKLVSAPKSSPPPKPARWRPHPKLCAHCDKPTERKHSIYDMPCHLKCERAHYTYITKTRAIKEYRLIEDNLTTLNYFELPNPHFGTPPPMMLYLLVEIEALAHRKISFVKNE